MGGSFFPDYLEFLRANGFPLEAGMTVFVTPGLTRGPFSWVIETSKGKWIPARGRNDSVRRPGLDPGSIFFGY
jgi:hypothetical protein